MEGWLCEQYQCRPSELDGEDINRLLRGRNALALYRAARKPPPWTGGDEEIMNELMQLDWERQRGGQ